MKKRFLLGCVFVLLLTPYLHALPSPQVEVKQIADEILAILKNSELSVEEKQNRISGRVQRFLNTDSMARRTLGDYWEEATLEQRQRFSDLFVKVLEGTYLSRIGDYSDGVVRYQKQRVKDDKAIIDTVIVAGDVEVPVQYKMLYVDDHWQVFDLVIEGISLIRNYRSTYGEIIRREGFEGLLTMMEEKIQTQKTD